MPSVVWVVTACLSSVLRFFVRRDSSYAAIDCGFPPVAMCSHGIESLVGFFLGNREIISVKAQSSTALVLGRSGSASRTGREWAPRQARPRHGRSIHSSVSSHIRTEGEFNCSNQTDHPLRKIESVKLQLPGARGRVPSFSRRFRQRRPYKNDGVFFQSFISRSRQIFSEYQNDPFGSRSLILLLWKVMDGTYTGHSTAQSR
ncbi:hypothetical protein QBC38DRAFT_59498 [Podospora fimiseda]|uniref:Secreted protein n=1 Tax=Podospora fimiseda TaxID=252190 RepID=A0AAN7BGX5_9PEZI|nr:hypothetical protein QBC38DRAFT_59498 [Podospora fimiseda]